MFEVNYVNYVSKDSIYDTYMVIVIADDAYSAGVQADKELLKNYEDYYIRSGEIVGT